MPPNYGAIPPERNLPGTIRPAWKTPIILGLVFMGVFVSTVIFITHVITEQLEPQIDFHDFLPIMFAFILLPGGLAGVAAGEWINATSRISRGHLLERLLAGILVYLAFITLFVFTQIHLLLFLCGPAITLLIYRFPQWNN